MKSNDPLVKRGANILSAWDRMANADSRGAVLFMEWLQGMKRKVFSDKWSANKPWSTPTILADNDKALKSLIDACQLVLARYEKLDVSYGDVYRLKVGKYDEPASGQSGYPGSFRVVGYTKGKDNKYTAVHGDTYVSVMEFAKDSVKAKGLLSYGNASEPTSLHRGDQLPMFARNQWRDIYLDRSDVEKHEKSRKTLNRK